MKTQKPSRTKPPETQILFSQGESACFQSRTPLTRIFRSFLELFPQQTRRVECRFVCSAEMKTLNRHYKKKNKATDVLSFKASGRASILGSIIIDIDTVKQQAKSYRHSLEREVQELFSHGLLHLAGMDHENFAEAQLMKVYEEFLMKRGSQK